MRLLIIREVTKTASIKNYEFMIFGYKIKNMVVTINEIFIIVIQTIIFVTLCVK
jgi:hypothetical protein